MPRLSIVRVAHVVAAILGLLCSAFPVHAQGEAWQVTLTQKQKKAFDETVVQDKPSGFAVSPDGMWGRAWGVRSNEDAIAIALHFCRFYLRPGKRDCVPYALNGKIIAPAVVSVPKVSKIYKPVNGRKAAAFFGIAGVNFAGDRAGATQQLRKVEADPKAATRLKSDPGLTAILSKYSLTSVGSGGFALALSDGWAEQHSSSNSGVLELRHADWVATREGLLCLINGWYASTGKRVGTRCMVIDQIAAGKVQFSWSGSLNVRRKGQIVAGDATRTAVR